MYKINITPQPTPRPRIRTITVKGKRINGTYYPQNYTKYKKDMAMLIKGLRVPKGDYSQLIAEFASPYPKSTPRKRLIEGAPMRNKFDLDNVCKGLMDAMEDAGVLEDDRQICAQKIRKVRTCDQGYIKFILIK